MDLETLTSAISTITFKEYDEIQELICLPDGSLENDPLIGQVNQKRTGSSKTDFEKKQNNGFQNKIRINYLDSFLFCFFSRFNTSIPIQKYHVDYNDFKRAFLDELRNGAMRNWKISTNKRDKGIILSNIEKCKLDKYTIQWIADYHDILIRIDDKEYIPRKSKENKPLLNLNYFEDGYKLN